MNARRTPVPLILCCADDGEVALVAALDELNRQGYSPEVLMGVENDAAALMSTVDRIQGPALFVLCASGDLDRAHVRRLSGLFSARRGPEHRLLSVTLESGNGLAILPQIESALQAIDEGPRPAPQSEGYNMRDVIGPTGVSAIRRQAAERQRNRGKHEEKIARELHDEMIQAERVLTRRKVERETYGRRGRPGDPRASGVRGGSTRAARGTGARGVRGTGARATARSVGAPVAPSLDHPADEFVDANTEPLHAARHAADSDAGIPRAIDNDNALAGTRELADGSSSGLVVEREIGPDPGQPDARRESDERPIHDQAALEAHRAARDRAMAEEVLERTDRLRPAAVAAAAESMRAPVPSRPMGKVLLLLSGAGMAALIGLAVTNMTESTPASPRPASASPVGAGGGSTPAAMAQPQGVDGPRSGAAAGAAPTRGTPPAAGDAAASEGPAASGGDGNATAAPSNAPTDPSSDPSSDSPAGDPAAAGGSPATDAGHTSPPSPPTKQLPASVTQALSQGRIKQSGKVLFVPASRETMTWGEADRRCRQRKIAGLGGWRLPTKGQLTQLRRHGYVKSGSYWTRQVVGGDEVYAFDAKSGMSSLWLKVEPNGRSLCARRTP